MLIALILIGVGIIASIIFAVIRWRAEERRYKRSFPLFFVLNDPNRSRVTSPLPPVAGGPVSASSPESPASRASGPAVYGSPVAPSSAQLSPASRWSPPVGISVPSGGAAGAAALAPQHSPVAHTPTSISGPTQLRVVRDRLPELAMYHGEPASDATVRFRRPSDEPVQLLPGRLEVLAGEASHREIRFVRVPGRSAELTLGREPGDSAQHVTLRSTTVSRRHARFAFLDGRWAVMNLSHTNPIVINGAELSSTDASYYLRDGDRLELGEVVLRYHVQ